MPRRLPPSPPAPLPPLLPLRSAPQLWLARSAYGTWQWNSLFDTANLFLKKALAALPPNETAQAAALDGQIKTLDARSGSFIQAKARAAGEELPLPHDGRARPAAHYTAVLISTFPCPFASYPCRRTTR